MKVMGRNQHGFMKDKSCLTNLIVSYGKMTDMVDDRRAMEVVYLGFQVRLSTPSPITSS